MVSKKSCFPTLPGTPAFEPGMRRLVFGGKYQRYVKGGADSSCAKELLGTEILDTHNTHGPGDVTEIRVS